MRGAGSAQPTATPTKAPRGDPFYTPGKGGESKPALHSTPNSTRKEDSRKAFNYIPKSTPSDAASGNVSFQSVPLIDAAVENDTEESKKRKRELSSNAITVGALPGSVPTVGETQSSTTITHQRVENDRVLSTSSNSNGHVTPTGAAGNQGGFSIGAEGTENLKTKDVLGEAMGDVSWSIFPSKKF